MKKLALILALVLSNSLFAQQFPNPFGSVTFDLTTGVVRQKQPLNFALGGFQINSSSALDVFAMSSTFFQSLASVDDPGIFIDMIGAEPNLGNPPVDGYVLAGSPNGGRSWIPRGSTTGTVQSVMVTAANGISASVADPTRFPNLTFKKLTNINPDNVTLPFGGRITGTVSSYPNTDLTSATLDWSQSNKFQRKYTGSTTMIFSNRVNGQTIRIKQQQTSGTLTWPAAVVAPTPAAPSGNEDIYECEDWNGSVNCRQLAANFTVGATPSPTVSPSPTPVPTPTPTPTPTPVPTATPTPTPAPVITVQPKNKTVQAGQTASFSVTATGAPTLTYQWRKNGAALTGATNSSYVTPVTTVAGYNGSTYSVVVANPGGNTTSSNATLTVTAAPTPTPSPIPTPTPSPTVAPTPTPAPAVAPVFSPTGSSARANPSAVQVTMTTTTSGGQIRYTTNGTTPTSSSTLYTGVVTTPNHTITVLKALTVKAGIPNSTVTSGEYDNRVECCVNGTEPCCDF